jgi:hypothetical protein
VEATLPRPPILVANGEERELTLPHFVGDELGRHVGKCAPLILPGEVPGLAFLESLDGGPCFRLPKV